MYNSSASPFDLNITSSNLNISSPFKYLIDGVNHTHLWSEIYNTPTTLSGYGIIDALSLSTSGQFSLSGHVHNSRELTDISSATPVNGQVLVYSSSINKYIPTTLSATSSNITKLTGTFNTTSGGVSGTTNVSLNTNLTIPYVVQFFDISDGYNVIQNYAVTNYSNNGFTVKWNAGSPFRTVYWVAIG